MIEKVKRWINNLFTRAVIELAAQDPEALGKVIVQVSGLFGETRSDVEHLQQYGMRSIPFGPVDDDGDGARGIWIAYGGSKENSTVFCVDDKRFGKFELQPGDCCLYSKNGAHTIYRGDDIIEILDGTKTITIKGMKITINENEQKIEVGGMTAIFDSSGLDVASGGKDVVADGVSLINHTHTIVGGSSAGETLKPS